MKIFFIVILLFTNISCTFAIQKDSIFCFSKNEIITLANKVRGVQDSITYFRVIGAKKDSLIILQDSAYTNAIIQIKNYKLKDDLWKKKELEYKNIIKKMEPAWYENKFIWFGLGVLTTIIVSK